MSFLFFVIDSGVAALCESKAKEAKRDGFGFYNEQGGHAGIFYVANEWQA